MVWQPNKQTSMTATSPSYYIPPEPGSWAAPALALLVHLALFVFFFIGIDWHSETPIAVEAEVWDVKVRDAAPKAEVPPPTPPTPPEPVKVKETPTPPPVEKKPEEITPPKVDIALEKENKKKLAKEKQEKEKLEKEKQEKAEKLAQEKKLEEKKLAEEEKKKQLAEKKRKEAQELAAIEKRRAEDLRRITGNGAPNSTGDAARSTGPRGDPSYAAAIKAKIKSNIVIPGGLEDQGNPQAEFKITLSPSGDVWNVKKIKSSGVAAYDTAVENAINKSSPLPRKKDGTVEREITATFKLKELQE